MLNDVPRKLVKDPSTLTNNLLITGASTGIGAACALYMAEQGWTVFAGVRREEDGEALMEQAKDTEHLIPVMLDVTESNQIQETLASITESLGERGLQGLFNNAGICVAGPLEELPMDRFEAQMNINVNGQLAVTQAAMPLLRQGQGRIIFTSSTSGFLSTPLLGPYCASKFALEAMADALRGELRPWKIPVVLIQPGAIATPIWDKTKEAGQVDTSRMSEEGLARYQPLIDKISAHVDDVDERCIPAEDVAHLLHKTLTIANPKTRYRIGKDAGLQYFMGRYVPDKIRDWAVLKALRL